MRFIPRFDMASVGLFLAMGGCAALHVRYAHKSGKRYVYIGWFLVWTVLAAFRYVNNNGIGGADSMNYIHFFEGCFGEDIWTKTDKHMEELFQIITKLIRSYTDNFRIYYLILYGAIVWSYITFINEFHSGRYSCIPLLLSAIVFTKSYNTLRTSLAASFILTGVVLLYRKKKIRSAIVIAASFFIHRTAIAYILFLPFYYLFKSRKLKMRYGVILAACASGLIKVVKMWLLTGGVWLLDLFDTGMLRVYLIDPPFSRAALLIQMSCFMALGAVHRDLYQDLQRAEDGRFHMLYMLVFYDFIMTPVYTSCGIWRAPEYFYLPRLLMWGYTISIYRRKFARESKVFVTLLFAAVFVALFIYNISISKDMLMPYIFAPMVQS